MRETVAIIGGGVAGLSAAHELIERGFDVHVYERRPFFGGKAASYRTASSGAGDPGRPGEHGFRFFPGWYRHVTDTMSRIPYHRPGGGRRTVLDNLVSVQANLLAWFDRAPVELPLHVPRTASEVNVVSQFFAQFVQLGLSPGEVRLFFTKLVEFVAMSDEKRAEKLEGVSWWDYLGCANPERSRAYQDLVRATTRTLVAAKAEEASAYSIGRVAVRTFLDTLSSVDRVLNGPTSEVWIKPWVDHLNSLGVKFHTDLELLSIRFDRSNRKVRELVMEPVVVTNARRLRKLLTRHAPVNGQNPSRRIQESARELARDIASADALAEMDPHLGALLSAGEDGGLSNAAALAPSLAALEAHPRSQSTVNADYFILALPLEQLAYYVNRSAMLTFLAPELRDVISLARHMDWMSGVQFYLQGPLDVAAGHLVGLDSNWALTAIEHTQFWKDVPLPPDVKAILSVDISAWDRPGRKTRKPAFNCTDQEIAEEVWEQLREMLNKKSRVALLRNDLLVGGRLIKGLSYHLDDSVVDLRDRKKQAFYERARGLQFSTPDLVLQGQASDEPTLDDAFMWGPRRRFNAEPLLVNRPGSRQLRPEAGTSIPNLFLAGDYVKTETDLACMEGANEAARRAVNGVLDAADSDQPRCELWPFSPSRQAAQALLAMSGAAPGLGTAAAAISRIQDRFWKGLALGMMRIQGGSEGPAAGRWNDTLSRR